MSHRHGFLKERMFARTGGPGGHHRLKDRAWRRSPGWGRGEDFLRVTQQGSEREPRASTVPQAGETSSPPSRKVQRVADKI